MQNVYTKGQEWACEEVEKASDSILRLLNSRALSQVIFTQYLATKHPEGVWKEYNKVNAAVNADPWLNEMMSEFLPYTKKYPVYTKSVYSSFVIPQVRELAKHASRVVQCQKDKIFHFCSILIHGKVRTKVRSGLIIIFPRMVFFDTEWLSRNKNQVILRDKTGMR